MSMEPFLYLLLFLFIAFLSFVMRWLRGEIEKRGSLEETPKRYGLFQESPAPFVYAEEKLGGREEEISGAPLIPSSRSGRRLKRVTIRPTNLQEMRRGIVLMTVLGPCRALEPPDEPLRF